MKLAQWRLTKESHRAANQAVLQPFVDSESPGTPSGTPMGPHGTCCAQQARARGYFIHAA